MFGFTQGLSFLPAFLAISASSTFIFSYIIAITRGDVDIFFPYISDTGATPPESGFFGLMTFISACAGIATIYARYKFVEKLAEETSVVGPGLNKCAFVIGMLSCLGMCIVATFQETTIPEVHDAGALLFFLSGVIYALLQSIISHRAYPFGSSICMCRARWVISIFATMILVPTVVCAGYVKQKTLHRDPEEKDYPYYLASAICEWIVAFSLICFFLTYIEDFKLFTLRVKTELQEES